MSTPTLTNAVGASTQVPSGGHQRPDVCDAFSALWAMTRAEPIVQPGDPAQPLAFDLRAGWRRDLLTLRWSAGVGAFGDAQHLPLRGSLAVLLPFEGSGRFGFWGIELDADGARGAPFVVALDVVPNLEPTGLPLRIGLALPWTIGERDDRPSLGLFLRVFYESAREIEFAAPRQSRATW